jgi:hypothetical protein
MTTIEIYNEITALLNTFPDNKSFKLGISKDARLTLQYGQRAVWHLPSEAETKALLKKLHADFGLTFNEGSSGSYIYVDTFKLNQYFD